MLFLPFTHLAFFIGGGKCREALDHYPIRSWLIHRVIKLKPKYQIDRYKGTYTYS